MRRTIAVLAVLGACPSAAPAGAVIGGDPVARYGHLELPFATSSIAKIPR